MREIKVPKEKLRQGVTVKGNNKERKREREKIERGRERERAPAAQYHITFRLAPGSLLKPGPTGLDGELRLNYARNW